MSAVRPIAGNGLLAASWTETGWPTVAATVAGASTVGAWLTVIGTSYCATW